MFDPAFVPARGDVVWLSFNPQAGHEQAGRRPGLIISPLAYNQKTGLVLVCPLSNQVKNYSFEVALPSGLEVTGVILADQIKSFDWKVRRAELICPVPLEIGCNPPSALATFLSDNTLGR